MLRLTALLLVGIYATMAIWGEAPEGAVDVSRADTPQSVPALTRVAVDSAPATPAELERARISEAQALQMAMDATAVPKERPAEAVAAAPPAEQAPQGQIRYVTGSRVNLRSAPSTNSAIVGGLSRGDRAELLSDPGEPWVRIRTESGVEAWMSSRFLSETPA